MPKRSSKGKPKDVNVIASEILEAATGFAEKEKKTTKKKSEKNPAAVALGKLGGQKGGKARAKKLSKEERIEIARKAAQMRWMKEPKKS